MRTRGRRCGMTVAAAAWTGTRPTSSPPTSQALHGKGAPAGNAPPDGGSQRQAELPAAADACYHHAAVPHRDLSAHANRRCHQPSRRPVIAPAAVPDGSLWCRVAGALSQVLACLADRHARPAGGGADVGDGSEQGVLLEVVALPPGDLIEQVRVGPAMKSCRRQHRVLELLVLPAAEGALGQEPLA